MRMQTNFGLSPSGNSVGGKKGGSPLPFYVKTVCTVSKNIVRSFYVVIGCLVSDSFEHIKHPLDSKPREGSQLRRFRNAIIRGNA